MICANGCPKSGTHALLKACELLGKGGRVDHIEYGRLIPDWVTKHVFIYRDPRNVLLSRLRKENVEITTGTIMAHAPRLIGEAANYIGWLNEPGLFTCRYEDLISNPETIKKLADYLEVPYREEAFAKLPGRTITWMPEHVDFTKVWNDELVKHWSDNKYDEVCNKFGYSTD